MSAYHIYITGMVQGVGFRPYVHKLAKQMQLDGWVSNGIDGVHIICSGSEEVALAFYDQILQQPPPLAIITEHQISPYDYSVPKGFFIQPSVSGDKMQMLITPDVTLCDDCRRELHDETNKRYHYPFTTCLNCGPRYSITTSLPYDRIHTTMKELVQCPDCKNEYDDLENGRHHSQTNSCPHCTIKMHLHNGDGTLIESENEACLELIHNFLLKGKIIAVKGVGGYLLICDATQVKTISTLRARKQRPTKPFALLYADLEMLYADADIRPMEVAALKERSAPIVLCKLKKFTENRICNEQIAPNLHTIGAMLPSSPLLDLIANRFGKPLVATSANLSGSPIIFEDDQALEWLGSIADHILVYDRKIMAPQDDSVLQFTERGQKIILRRSRGLAPNYFPLPSIKFTDAVLAMGAELKSAYAIAHHDLLFVSQFLGDQQSVESQKSFQTSLDQVCNLLECSPEIILVDQHPGYFVSQEGIRMAKKKSIPVTHIQHHEAHFASVMAENDLFETNRPVLGIICDGAGYGHDGQIWGGEVFVYDEGMIKRAAHLEYFPQFLGDKMNKEPRLSALSLLRNFSKAQQLLQKHFTDKEWDYYTRLLSQPQQLMTSSMGRLIDAVGCLLGMPPISGYEGEAAMQLEALAKTCTYRTYDYYHLPLHNGVLDWKPLLHELIEDWNQKEPNEMIAWKFFYSLARAIAKLSDHYYIDQVAFSGGVFQNALLVDMLIELMQKKRQLFFHKQVSPNDECIGLGQLAWYSRFGNKGQEKMQDQKVYSNSQLSFH